MRTRQPRRASERTRRCISLPSVVPRRCERAAFGRRARRCEDQHRRDALMFAAGGRRHPSAAALSTPERTSTPAENDRGQTPLIFADGKRPRRHGQAAPHARRRSERRHEADGPLRAQPERREPRRPEPRGQVRGAAVRRRRGVLVPGVERQHMFNEQVAAQGGLTPLLYAVRQGFIDVARRAARRAACRSISSSPATTASALLVATINGQFDLAGLLLERGANPNLAAENGVAPLYAAINLQWAPRARLSAAARAGEPADELPRLHEAAARRGRGSQSARQQEGLVHGLQLRPVRRRRSRRHGVLARGVRCRRRRDEAARVVRRGSEHPDDQTRAAPRDR